MVKVNLEKCKAVGLLVKSLKSPMQKNVLIEKNETSLLKLLCVMSICHNINHDKHLRAWDTFISSSPEKFNAEYLADLSAEEYESWFEGLDEKRTDGEVRSAFIRDLSSMLLSKYSGSVVELLDSCEGKIGGEAGLLMRLDLFKAYAEDPLKKKSAAFISELVGKGLAEFSDMENIPPTVDYHVTRMFIRLGVIDVEEYMDKINSGVEFTLEEDTAVRLNVAEAAKEMAKYSEHNIGDQSFLFWQIARNCCRKDKTWCKQCVKENCTFVKQTPNDCLKRCLFTNVCDNKENALSITEPKIKTTYY